MPRQMRIEYPGAIYHVMSRGTARPIFLDDGDRHDFLKTLAEACGRPGSGSRLLSDEESFSPGGRNAAGNLVAGMRWLLSTYSNRFNHRHELCGHV